MYIYEFLLGYVDALYHVLISTPQEHIKNVAQELENNKPAPMHTMLENKVSRSEAVSVFEARKAKITEDCPATCTGIYIAHLYT